MIEGTTENGVKVVGAPAPDVERSTAAPEKPPEKKRRRVDADRGVPSRRAFRLVSLLAVIGLIGTLVFGILYTTKSSSGGPVLNSSGKVIGLLSMGTADAEHVSFAVPVSAVRELLRAQRSPTP